MIVVSDTSPIRALCYLAQIQLLRELFTEILLPPAVRDELASPPDGLNAIDVAAWDFLHVEAVLDVAQVDRFSETLDLGESEALALALERNADAVLIDERVGRAAAQKAGLNVIGTLGILVSAKQQSLVEEVAPMIDRLQDELGFFVSAALRDEILRLAGE